MATNSWWPENWNPAKWWVTGWWPGSYETPIYPKTYKSNPNDEGRANYRGVKSNPNDEGRPRGRHYDRGSRN
jgi:hypothetical protein